MDATLAGTLSSEITGFQADAIAQIGSVLPLALGVAISVAVVFLGVRMFRSIAHV